MRDFHDIRYDGAVGRDLECSVSFVTDVVRTKKGGEFRNARLGQPRHGYRWSVARAATEIDSLKQFHNARKGGKSSFRFQDPFDCILPLTVLSTGSTATDFDIVKRYTAGGTTFERRILLVDTSQTTVYVNSTKLDSSAWSISTAYQLHLNAAPGAGKPVSIEGVFDVPCRFDAEMASRIASPEADDVTIELTEARLSPAVAFSTGSTWTARTCNIMDSSFYFFDGFSSVSLSTDWMLTHVHINTTIVDSSGSSYTYRSGSSDQDTTVAGGYFMSSTLSTTSPNRILALALQKALHPPFRVRQAIRLNPSSEGWADEYSHYGITLDKTATTGAVVPEVIAYLDWHPFYLRGGLNFSTKFTALPTISGDATHDLPYAPATYTGAVLSIDFTTASLTMSLYPSTGGVCQLSVASTILTNTTYYMKVTCYAMHGYQLDWIEVKSL